MKVVFFNRFFHPDTSATSQIVSDLAFHLAGRGHEVHAVTSRTAQDQSEEDLVRGVRIHRVASATTGPHSLFEKAIAYVAYYRGARRFARTSIAPGDICVVKTDPPMLSAAIGPIAKRRGAKLVVWMQDVFPEIAREYGIPGTGLVLGSFLRRLRDRSLALADAVVAISARMAEHVARALGTGARLEVIHNWADGEAIRPVERSRNPLRREWGLEDAFVVGYSGNLGRVHEFDTFVDAATLLKDDARIRFLVIGRGPRLADVKERVKAAGLANVAFRGHQPRERLAESLSVPDVHLSVLQPRFEGLVHPSKLYGIMAAGRPTLFIGDAKGQTAEILADCGAGVAVACGDANALAREIVALRDDPARSRRMGSAAREAFDRRYAMPIAFGKWEQLLRDLTQPRPD
jgi:glycosyltransferase involved in cell wall biosynthesis